MKREQQIKSYIDRGWVTFNAQIISLNSETCDSWINDDTFFINLAHEVASRNAGNTFSFLSKGVNADRVESRLVELLPKIKLILQQSYPSCEVYLLRERIVVESTDVSEVTEIEDENKTKKVKSK